MPKFVSKTYTKDSPADYNYANDLETRIGNAIDPIDTKTKNIPSDGSFSPFSTNSISVTWSNELELWKNAHPNRVYTVNGNGTSLGYPNDYMYIRKIGGDYGSSQLVLEGFSFNNQSKYWVLGAAYYNGKWNSGGWVEK